MLNTYMTYAVILLLMWTGYKTLFRSMYRSHHFGEFLREVEEFYVRTKESSLNIILPQIEMDVD